MARKWILGVIAVVVVGVLVVVNRTQREEAAAPTPQPKGEYSTSRLLNPGQAAETARRFVALWSMPEPGDSNETWEERLDPLVTDEIGRGLLVADMEYLPRLPLSKATPPDFRSLSTSSATVVVTLSDGSEIAVEVVPYGPGYAVASFVGVGDG